MVRDRIQRKARTFLASYDTFDRVIRALNDFVIHIWIAAHDTLEWFPILGLLLVIYETVLIIRVFSAIGKWVCYEAYA